MESALIVSGSEKSTQFFSLMLNKLPCEKIVALKTAGEARRLILERNFDLIIINAPLSDETGERLSRHIAAKKTGQVLLLVSSPYFYEVSAATEDYGVMTLEKPVTSLALWAALKLAKSAQRRMQGIREADVGLSRKIENIRLADKAKRALVTSLGMTEQEAHRYLEKTAMDRRVSKRTLSEEIIDRYDG